MGATASIASRVCVLAEIKLALRTRCVAKFSLQELVSRLALAEVEICIYAPHSQLCSIRN